MVCGQGFPSLATTTGTWTRLEETSTLRNLRFPQLHSPCASWCWMVAKVQLCAPRAAARRVAPTATETSTENVSTWPQRAPSSPSQHSMLHTRRPSSIDSVRASALSQPEGQMSVLVCVDGSFDMGCTFGFGRGTVKPFAEPGRLQRFRERCQVSTVASCALESSSDG
jgi:hypothetical protein